MNQKSDVDASTRERILRIMEEQAFLPSITASKLAGGRSRMIGVLTPSLTWPLIPEILSGASEMLIQSPYELLLYSISREQDRNENDRRYVLDRILSANLAAGVLAVFPGQSIHYLTRLHQQGFPIVIIDDQGQPTSIPHVSAGNRQGAYKATRYLLQLGHQRIAHIRGPHKFLVSQERYEGYSEALREAGIIPDPALVMEGDFMPESGRACARKLLALADPPTAIFAASDQMAYGVLEIAAEHGLRVPADLSLIGFDDIASSAHMRPALTTVRQPFYEMGQRAVALLLSLLESSRPSLVGAAASPLNLPEDEAPAANKRRWQNAQGQARRVGGVPCPARPSLLEQSREPLHIQLSTYLVVRASCSIPASLSLHYRRK